MTLIDEALDVFRANLPRTNPHGISLPLYQHPADPTQVFDASGHLVCQCGMVTRGKEECASIAAYLVRVVNSWERL